MKKKDKQYQEELLQRLCRSSNLKRERQLFNRLSEQPIFWIVGWPNTETIFSLNGNPVCPNALNRRKKGCYKCFRKAVKREGGHSNVKQFICSEETCGLCLPLAQGDALYGFFVLCHLKRKPTPEVVQLFEALNITILEKVQKELELFKLYQTIRPRAIALSTIHTVHRLISSSLNLDELLPRIARLSLQVLRAKRCLISLVDKKTRQLVPKAVIDLSTKKVRARIWQPIGKIEKRVMYTSNVVLEKSYLAVPLIDEELIGVITISSKMNGRPFDNFDQEILNALSEQALGAIKNAQLYKEQEEMLLGTVESLANLLKIKSPHRYSHPKSFVNIVLGIAKELGLSEVDMQNLRYAAILHDAGKIGIPEEILRKPAHLTGKEFEIVKEHPKKSAKILSPLERLKPAIAIILHHHEKFNGTGYPDQLKGKNIPLGARIMAVADSFEAMVSRRPYRKTASISNAIKELKRHSGTQFDPKVIKAFFKLTQRRLKKAVWG